MAMLTLILDSANLKYRRVLALSKLLLGWAGTRNPFALLEMIGSGKGTLEHCQHGGTGYLLDMSNHQQIRY